MSKKTKRQILQLGIVGALLVAAVVAFVLLQNEPERDDDLPVTQETYVLGGVTQPFVKSVNLKTEDDDFTMVNDAQNAIQQENNANSTISIPGLGTDSLNQSTLKSVMTAAASMPASKVVVESGADLALYGLDSPRATVEIEYEDGGATLFVGDEAPGNEGTYVARAGDEAVYLVATSRVSNMLKPRLGFVSATITPGNNQSTRISAARLSGTLYAEPIVLEEMPEDEVSSITGFATYRITAPLQSAADSSNAVTVLQGVYGLTAEAVMDLGEFMGEDVAIYGLAEPYFLAEITTVAEEGEDPIAPFTLAISTPDEDGVVYAQSSLAPYVYRLNASHLAFLDLTLFDYQEKMILLPHIDSVSEVEVFAAGETHTFQLEGEGDELVVTCDGEFIDPKNFRQFYQTLIAARYDAVIEEDAPADSGSADEGGDAENAVNDSDDGDVLLRYTYRYRDGSDESVILFVSGPARRAIVSLNGGRGYYTQSIYVDRVLEDLPKVIAGQEVKSYY